MATFPSSGPKSGDKLDLILARLDALERRLEPVLQIVELAPSLVATAVDSADDVAAGIDSAGPDVESRVHQIVRLADLLTRPEMPALIEALARSSDIIAPAIGQASAIPGLVGLAADAVDELARGSEVQVDAALRNLSRMLARAIAVAGSPEFADFVQSGAFTPATFANLAKVADAVAAAGASKPAGWWRALRASRDPRVQQSLGFLIEVARQFGEDATTSQRPKALTQD